MKSWKTIVVGVPIMVVAIAVAVLASSTRAEPQRPNEKQASARTTGAKVGKASFAGGCFWCMEPPFE